MPPGLPSSVSTNIQKSFSPAPCLSSGIHSKRPQIFMSCALFHIQFDIQSLSLESSIIAAIQAFQVLQLCICSSRVKKEQKGKATYLPSHSFATCIYSVFYFWGLCFVATFLSLCQVVSSNPRRGFIQEFKAFYSSSSFFPFSLPLWTPYFLIFSPPYPISLSLPLYPPSLP